MFFYLADDSERRRLAFLLATDPYASPAASQLAWLKQDLAAANANRAAVPWILLTSHFPLYCSICSCNTTACRDASARWWVADSEFGATHPRLQPLLAH